MMLIFWSGLCFDMKEKGISWSDQHPSVVMHRALRIRYITVAYRLDESIEQPLEIVKKCELMRWFKETL